MPGGRLSLVLASPPWILQTTHRIGWLPMRALVALSTMRYSPIVVQNVPRTGGQDPTAA